MDVDEEQENQATTSTPSRATRQKKAAGGGLKEPPPISSFTSSFDAYFISASSSARTSNNVFSSTVAPFSQDEYSSIISTVTDRAKDSDAHTSYHSLQERHEEYLPHFLLELSQGFNLLFYGYGSKRAILNKFAANHCASKGNVVVANAFLPSFTIKDLLTSIEAHISDIPSLPLTGSGWEAQARRIHDYFSQDASQTSARPLFLIIHNIDSPPMRTQRAKACLSLLALSPRIHLVGSIDHTNAPLLWTQTETSTRKHSVFEDEDAERSSTRGFAWLWHDLTTLQPYDVELSYANRSSIAGASSASLYKKSAASNAGQVVMTESAAQHILASVTDKARKLFSLLGSRQLDAVEADGDKGRAAIGTNIRHYAIPYDSLFEAARTQFIVINDTAMRALLGEFRDHGLVLSSSGPEGDGLYIPLTSNVLSSILDHLAKSP